jgi:hypothetical protein
MSDDAIDRKVRSPRLHVCTRCRDIVEKIAVVAELGQWTITTTCHGRREITRVTRSQAEDAPRFWHYEPEVAPAQRLELHVYLHDTGETK